MSVRKPPLLSFYSDHIWVDEWVGRDSQKVIENVGIRTFTKFIPIKRDRLDQPFGHSSLVIPFLIAEKMPVTKFLV
jgi:hypothetical protein